MQNSKIVSIQGKNLIKIHTSFLYVTTEETNRSLVISSHYLAQLGGSCTEKGHLASRVPGKNSECAGVPADGSDGLTSVLPGHADPLWTTTPLQLQLPHHHQTLTGTEKNTVNNTGNTTKHTDTVCRRGEEMRKVAPHDKG